MGLSTTSGLSKLAIATIFTLGWIIALLFVFILYTEDKDQGRYADKATIEQFSDYPDLQEMLQSAHSYVPPMTGEIGAMQDRVNSGKWSPQKLAKEQSRYLKNRKENRHLHGVVFVPGVGVIDESEDR